MMVDRDTSGRQGAGRLRFGALLALLPGLFWGTAASTGPASFTTANAALRFRGDAHDIASHVSQIKDMEVAVRVTKLESKELDKIGRDFSVTYRLRNLTFLYKNPDKIRLEGKSHILGEALLILNGSTRFYSVPKLNVRKTENLENTPSKRQSLLEYGGLLSKETLSFMQGRYVRDEALDGHATSVFDLTYQGLENASHYRLWIDPKTRITLKRDWYDSENHLRATFTYQEPKEVAPGFWLPGRCEIKNAEGLLAASMTYGDAKVNQGLPDTLFSVTK